MIQSPLHWAAEAQSVGCVRLLLAWNAEQAPGEDVHATAVWHQEPTGGPCEVLRALLSRMPPTPFALNQAVRRNAITSVADLLAAGLDPNEEASSRHVRPIATVLGSSCTAPGAAGEMILRSLLGAGADPNSPCGMKGMYRPPALLAAIEAGAAWAVPILIEAGADVAATKAIIARHGFRVLGEDDRRRGVATALQRVALAW